MNSFADDGDAPLHYWQMLHALIHRAPFMRKGAFAMRLRLLHQKSANTEVLFRGTLRVYQGLKQVVFQPPTAQCSRSVVSLLFTASSMRAHFDRHVTNQK